VARPEGAEAVNIDDLAIEADPAAEHVRFLEDQINAFNIEQTGVPFGGFVSCFVQDDDGTVIAGVHGFTWGDCCAVEYLWVREDLRGGGLGSRLLALAEQEAVRRGCAQVVLDTHSFQAPAFYAKHGYEVVGVVDGYPGAHQKIYLRKALGTPAAVSPTRSVDG
jgi:GNAT superfamily N-acetyltransferase